MKTSISFKLILLAGVAAIFSAGQPAAAQAQVGGYDFGVGFGWAQQPLRLSTPREDLPYFAKFPPVYYGDMVRRPYGFSPYALPPGIEPVEQRIIEQRMGPRTIINPFYEPAILLTPPVPAPPAPPSLELPLEDETAPDSPPQVRELLDEDIAN